MLSEEEKQRIRAEEIYREEVRRELEGDERSRSWSILNSPFVLWCLGSVVISGLTFGHARIQVNRARAQQKSRVEQEIQYRLSEVEQILSIDMKSGNVDDVVKLVRGPEAPLARTIYPEHRTWPLSSLVAARQAYEGGEQVGSLMNGLDAWCKSVETASESLSQARVNQLKLDLRSAVEETER